MSPSARPVAHVQGLTVFLWDSSYQATTPNMKGAETHWRPAGYLITSNEEAPGLSGRFIYFPDYDGTPLDPIHLDYRRHPPGTPFTPPTHQTLWGVFQDSLPGAFGTALLAAHFPDYGRLNPIGKMAWLGKRRQSGLAFTPNIRGGQTDERYIDGITYLEAVRQKLTRHRTEALTRALDSQNTYGLTSLGGAREKAATVIDGRYYVAKFNQPGDPYDSLARVEHAALCLARASGIAVPDSRVITLPHSGEDVLLVERYDRSHGNRAHRLSLKTLTSIDNTGFARSTADARDVSRSLRAIGSPDADQWEWVRRIAFMAGARVTDNHLGNVEVMLDAQNRWGLTPAYDLVPVYGQSEFSTRLCGFTNTQQALSPHLAAATSRFLDLPEARVQTEIGGVWQAMAAQAERVAQKAGCSLNDQRRFLDAVSISSLRTMGQGLSQKGSEVNNAAHDGPRM